jgi:TolB-like protein
MPDIHSGKLIWAGSYDLNAEDLVAAQSEATARIAQAVGEHLQSRQQPPDK